MLLIIFEALIKFIPENTWESNKSSRRAENAARNEARRKQLAEKRALKTSGAKRLGTTKPS